LFRTVNDDAAKAPFENRTELVPHRFVPVIVTVEPTAPEVGEIPVTVGARAATTVKIGPLATPGVGMSCAAPVDPAGTIVTIVVSLLGVAGWLMPPGNVTPVLPVNPIPVSVTGVPTTPHSGLMVVIVPAAAAGPASAPTSSATRATEPDTATSVLFRSLMIGTLPSFIVKPNCASTKLGY
jgi:hypothetical protein